MSADKVKRIRRIAGVTLVVASYLTWGVVAGLPFLGISLATKGEIAGSMLIANWVMFGIGMLLLGKDIWSGLKKLARKLHLLKSPASPVLSKQTKEEITTDATDEKMN